MSVEYITIREGVWKGVTYKVNGIDVVEEDGKVFYKMDYRVKNLPEGQSEEFEKFLGVLVSKTLREEAQRGDASDGSGF